VGISSLKAEEAGLQPKAQQSTGRAEEVVRCGWQQVHISRVAADQGQKVALEGVAIRSVAELDARDQVGMRRQDLFDG